jgi:hypothetical protein
VTDFRAPFQTDACCPAQLPTCVGMKLLAASHDYLNWTSIVKTSRIWFVRKPSAAKKRIFFCAVTSACAVGSDGSRSGFRPTPTGQPRLRGILLTEHSSSVHSRTREVPFGPGSDPGRYILQLSYALTGDGRWLHASCHRPWTSFHSFQNRVRPTGTGVSDRRYRSREEPRSGQIFFQIRNQSDLNVAGTAFCTARAFDLFDVA